MGDMAQKPKHKLELFPSEMVHIHTCMHAYRKDICTFITLSLQNRETAMHFLLHVILIFRKALLGRQAVKKH